GKLQARHLTSSPWPPRQGYTPLQGEAAGTPPHLLPTGALSKLQQETVQRTAVLLSGRLPFEGEDVEEKGAAEKETQNSAQKFTWIPGHLNIKKHK
ncbi:hypothetical protein P7K49_012227, partial [Saguinus oedipus]